MSTGRATGIGGEVSVLVSGVVLHHVRGSVRLRELRHIKMREHRPPQTPVQAPYWRRRTATAETGQSLLSALAQHHSGDPAAPHFFASDSMLHATKSAQPSRGRQARSPRRPGTAHGGAAVITFDYRMGPGLAAGSFGFEVLTPKRFTVSVRAASTSAMNFVTSAVEGGALIRPTGLG